MAIKFIIEDELHAESQSEHSSLADAWKELRRLSNIPWDQAPNVAPCTSWRTCGRNYEIIEYDTSTKPWHLIRRIPALEISAKDIVWSSEAPRDNT